MNHAYGLFSKPSGPTSAAAFERAAQGVGRVADYAHERGLVMTFEVLNRYETFHLADGRVLKLDVYAPRRASDERRPAVLYIHGGGWAAGVRQQSEVATYCHVGQTASVVCVS